MLEAIIGVGGLVIINIVFAAYSYGRLTQTVKDLCRRVGRVENIVNGKGVKEETK